MSGFVKGDRVELLHTNDRFTRLRPGARGTVESARVDREGYETVSVKWDDGSALRMLVDEGDRIRKVTA